MNGVDPEALLASLIKGEAKPEALKSCFAGMRDFLRSGKLESKSDETISEYELPDYDSFYSGLAVVRYALDAEQLKKYKLDSSELLEILRESLAMDDPLSLASALDSLLFFTKDSGQKRELLLNHLKHFDFDPDGDVLLVCLEHIKNLISKKEEILAIKEGAIFKTLTDLLGCLLYTSPSPRDS